MMKSVIPFFGRIFLALIFLMSGLNKMIDPVGTKQYMEAHGMPLVGLFFIGAIILEIGGALCLIFGYNAKRGALALIIFLIPTTLIFHTNFADKMQIILFMKNLAVLGGLFFVASFGPGSLSFDERKKGG